MHVCHACFLFRGGTNTGCDTTRLPLPRTGPGGFSTVQRAPPIGEQKSEQRRAGKIPFPQIREMLCHSEIILIRTHGTLHLQESQACVVGKRKKQEVRQIHDYSSPFLSLSLCSLKAQPDPTHLNARRRHKD